MLREVLRLALLREERLRVGARPHEEEDREVERELLDRREEFDRVERLRDGRLGAVFSLQRHQVWRLLAGHGHWIRQAPAGCV